MGGEAAFEGGAAGFDGHLEGIGHAVGIAGDGNGGVDEDGVSAHFHGFGGVTRSAEAGVDDDGDGSLFDDDADLVAGLDAAIGTDRRAEGHDGRDADVLEAFGKDGIGVDVRQDGELFFDEEFGGFKGFDRVGQEIAGVGMNFEFDPFGKARGSGEARKAHGFFCVSCATGVGQEEILFGIDEFEDIGERVFFAGEISAAEGDGDHFGAGGVEGVAHGFGRGKFAGSQDEAGTEDSSGDNQRLVG